MLDLLLDSRKGTTDLVAGGLRLVELLRGLLALDPALLDLSLGLALLGAVAGYAISLWRFRGDTWIFAIVTLGIFLPQQMRLIPWTFVPR